MIIALDVGNTNILIGCLDADKIYFTARLTSEKRRTADEYHLNLLGLLRLHNIEPQELEGGILSSVVPVITASCREALEKLTGKEPLVVGSGLKTGLNILIDNPAQLGSDLVVNAVAALAEYPKPVMVLDLGTATKLSVLDKQGNYIGGVIMSGVNLTLDALFSRTAQLPRITLEGPKRVVGTNTVDCMKSGAVYGHAAMLDGMVERAEDELGERATVVATGGLSGSIVKYCKCKVICDEYLMLKGLLILYRKNTK